MQSVDFLHLLEESSKSASHLLQRSIDKKNKMLSFQNVQESYQHVQESYQNVQESYLGPRTKSVQESNLTALENEGKITAAYTNQDNQESRKAIDGLNKENLVIIQKSTDESKIPTKSKNTLASKPSSSFFLNAEPINYQPLTESMQTPQKEGILEESAAKMFDYSAMIIKKNDGIVRQQQELVFEQTKRQIERLEKLQEMQVDSITRILKKQVRYIS